MPGDNGVDLYINDIGCVVILEPDGTLAIPPTHNPPPTHPPPTSQPPHPTPPSESAFERTNLATPGLRENQSRHPRSPHALPARPLPCLWGAARTRLPKPLRAEPRAPRGGAGKTLKGFNIVVGGGMGRTHKAEQTFARAASHLGFAPKEHFFEAMKAILAVQRDHGNREAPPPPSFPHRLCPLPLPSPRPSLAPPSPLPILVHRSGRSAPTRDSSTSSTRSALTTSAR